MGGIGSRNQPQRTLVEDCLILDVNELARMGCFQLGEVTCKETTWRIDGVRVARAKLEVDLRCERSQPNMRMTLTRPNQEDVTQIIALRDIAPTFGGIRWFFRARDGQRCQKLYLPLGSNRFGTRQEYQLAYRSQMLSPADCARWRAQQLQEALPGARFQHYPPRPKRMHRRTYDRLVGRLRESDDKVRDNWQESMMKAAKKSGLVRRARAKGPGAVAKA
jgi:hypothetical protein